MIKPELQIAAVLDVLEELNAPMPERTIVLAINTLLRLEITYGDLARVLKSMEEKRLVVGIASDTHGAALWAITSEGKLHLSLVRSGAS